MVQEAVGCFFQANTVNVPTPGSAVQISSAPDRVRRITFKALAGNTGDVYVGGSDVSSTVGLPLSPGESVPLDFSPETEPLTSFYVDAANANDKVSWIIGASSASGQLAASHSHDSHTGTLSVNEGGTGAAIHTDGGLLIGKGTSGFESTGVLADGEMVVGDGTTNPVLESGDTLRTSIGVGSGDSPTFTGLTLTTGLTMSTARALWAKGGDLASGATVTPGTDGNFFDITGTTGITAIATLQAGAIVIFQFDGIVIITHNGTSLILQGATNLTTAAGDIVAFISEGSGNWRELFRRLVTASAVTEATQSDMEDQGTTNANRYVSPETTLFHPGVAKAWCHKTAAGALSSPDHGISSIDDHSTGALQINLDTAFSSVIYLMAMTNPQEPFSEAGHVGHDADGSGQAVGDFQLEIVGQEPQTQVDVEVGFIFYGDQ